LLALELHLLLDLKALKHIEHLSMLLLHALKILEEGVPVFSEMVFFLLDFFELLPGPFFLEDDFNISEARPLSTIEFL
jgi:hypothetical protein